MVNLCWLLSSLSNTFTSGAIRSIKINHLEEVFIRMWYNSMQKPLTFKSILIIKAQSLIHNDLNAANFTVYSRLIKILR